MHPSIAIAVVSDLHVGSAARSIDLNPRPNDAKYIEKAYIEKFEKFIEKQSIQADFLIVPGDITNRAAPDEFQLASTQIQRIASALGVTEDRVLFVPGNHDVDWTVLTADPDDKSDFRLRQRYQPLQQQDCVFARILGRATINKITEADTFCIWEFPDALVVGLNSAYHDLPTTRIHHGLIAREALAELDFALQGYSNTPSRLRVAIFHHHPVQYSDPIPNEPDFSAMTNAEALLRLLEKYDFDIAIHGHKHKPNFNVWQVSSYFQLPILGAGSFSYQLDPRWNGLVNNQFHLVEVHGRDSSTRRIRGLVKSFTYLCGHGWRGSRENNGIDHEIFFGGFSSDATLEIGLREIIVAEFQQANYIKWQSLVLSRPDLKYVAWKLVMRVLDRLAIELDFIVHDNDPGKTLLLKR